MSQSVIIKISIVFSLFVFDLSFAMYIPQEGRFLQQDPIGTSPIVLSTEQGPKIIGTGGPTTPNVAPTIPTASQEDKSSVTAKDPKSPLQKVKKPLALQIAYISLLNQYDDGMNLYQYVKNNPMNLIDPLGLSAQSKDCPCGQVQPYNNFEQMRDMMKGCRMARPQGDVGQKLMNAGSGISNNLLLCMFWQESSMGQSPNYMKGPYIGLGQLGQSACQDVDRLFKLPSGTCWRRQQSGSMCEQAANTEAYLAIQFAFYNKTSIRDALKGYGPGDAPYGEYADPLLNCEKCMNGSALGDGFVSSCSADNCFKDLNKQVQGARKSRRP